MISKKYKFIYIHIPKTGGNSIQTALAPYADDRLFFRKSIGNIVDEDGLQGLSVFNDELGFTDSSVKHATISHYHHKLGNEIYSYFIFASIRNPWDRVVSQTAFFSKTNLPLSPLAIEELNLPSPMVDYLSVDGRILVGDFIRFESLQYDFNRVCERLGIEKIRLPHKNRSNRSGFSNYYSNESRIYVQEKFKSDIDVFGYAFNEGAVAND